MASQGLEWVVAQAVRSGPGLPCLSPSLWGQPAQHDLHASYVASPALVLHLFIVNGSFS